MKLLLDNNLSYRLISRLSALFPESKHVVDVGLDEASDEAVWQFAKENDFVIVTKDADFNHLSMVYGAPPKVVWIKTGNCKLSIVETLIHQDSNEILRFGSDDGAEILEIG